MVEEGSHRTLEMESLEHDNGRGRQTPDNSERRRDLIIMAVQRVHRRVRPKVKLLAPLKVFVPVMPVASMSLFTSSVDIRGYGTAGSE